MNSTIKGMLWRKSLESGAFRAVLPDAAMARQMLTQRPEVAAFVVQRAEAALRAPWPALPASLYLDFARTGARASFEAAVFRRRDLVRDLLLGELVEGRGRFVGALADAVWSVTEEATWCWPAHLFLQKAGYGLPDVDEPVVDLGTGTTAGLLAMVSELLAEPLDAVSPMIRQRVERVVRQRLLDPCRDRDDFWWMGLTPHPIFHVIRLNNWTSWVGSNWLLAHIAFETEPDAFVHGINRIVAALDRLLAIYGEDGGCPEGPGYWRAATSGLLQCLELLRPGLDVEFLRQDARLRNIGRFILDTHIADDYYVNFADAAPRTPQPACLVRRWADLVDDDRLRGEADRLAARQGLLAPVLSDTTAEDLIGNTHQNIFESLAGLAVLPKLAPPNSAPVRSRNVWFETLQVAIARDSETEGQGWFLAAKAGHNGDSHNHNDVGSFLLYRDGRPLIVDAGVGTYTAQTFSDRRYEIWTMRSGYHNVPQIDGHEQMAGAEHAASAVRFVVDGDVSTLSMDLTKAYPAEAGVAAMRRTIRATRGHGVEIEDQIETGSEMPIELHLLCAADVRLVGAGEIALVERFMGPDRPSASGRLTFSPDLEVHTEIIDMEDPALERHWGPHLTLLRLRSRRQMATLNTTVTFSA